MVTNGLPARNRSVLNVKCGSGQEFASSGTVPVPPVGNARQHTPTWDACAKRIRTVWTKRISLRAKQAPVKTPH